MIARISVEDSFLGVNLSFGQRPTFSLECCIHACPLGRTTRIGLEIARAPMEIVLFIQEDPGRNAALAGRH